MDEVFVDVMDHTMCVAYNRQVAPLAMELGLDEHADRQRERRSESELAQHVDLMGCSSTLDEQGVSRHDQFIGILAVVDKQPVPRVTQQPGQRLFKQVAA